jgi:hypothetical protein
VPLVDWEFEAIDNSLNTPYQKINNKLITFLIPFMLLAVLEMV